MRGEKDINESIEPSLVRSWMIQSRPIRQWVALLPLAVVAGLFDAAHAGVAKKGERTDTISVPGMQCGMCEERINDKLSGAKGVLHTQADADAKRVIVTYNTKQTTKTAIERLIAAAGYDTKSARASETVKAALPDCCRVQ
jgi:periplasmic mercuric ion binding protein